MTYRAYPNEEVILSGSKILDMSAFAPVSGDMKDKLPTEAAQNNVLVADASDLGIDPITVGVTDSGFTISAPLMMLDDHNMNLIRYPNAVSNENWHSAETVDPVQSASYPTLKIDDETFWSWNYKVQDFVYFGYFSWGWAASAFHDQRNAEEKTVTATDRSHYGNSYGSKPTKIYNAYQSIDEPGEWYYDSLTNKLYIYPFEDTTANSRLYMTIGNHDIVTLDGVIENNVFHDVNINGKDIGAIYGGREARCQGTIIRNNHIYNMGNNDGSYNHTGIAIYMDDGLSSNYVNGLLINGGHDNVFANNLLIDVPSMFHIYIHADFENYIRKDEGNDGIGASLRAIWDNELYTARWPWMAAAHDGSNDFYIENRIKENVLVFTDTVPHSTSSYQNYNDKWYMVYDYKDCIEGLATNKVIECKKASTKLDTGKVLFRPGWTYDVTFGMVDVNNDAVRIIMTVDGTEVFNEVVEDSALVGAQTYFGLITSGGATLTVNGAGNEEHFDKYDTVTVDAMLAETTGWKDFTWTDPSFGGASVPVDGVATVANSKNNYKHITYTKTAYKDAQFHFQYTVNNTKEEFSQRFFVENASDPYYYVGPGVYVQFFMNKTVFYVTGAGGTVVASATDNAKKLVSGQEYTMDLSVYTVDADANNVRVVLKVDDAVWYDGCNRRERSSGNQFLLLRCTGKIVHCYRESCVVETRQHRAWDKPKPGLALQPRFLPAHLQKRCAHRNGDAPLRSAIKLFCSIIRSADDTHLSYGVVHCPGAGCVNLPDENAVAFR